ncbi:hypothetical protein [Methanolacinia petrolearia]|uniref:hypothetical protein n=1 Tax=Methanolacinia petrolearia TaxID=54120 RepID=UPI003BAA2C65
MVKKLIFKNISWLTLFFLICYMAIAILASCYTWELRNKGLEYFVNFIFIAFGASLAFFICSFQMDINKNFSENIQSLETKLDKILRIISEEKIIENEESMNEFSPVNLSGTTRMIVIVTLIIFAIIVIFKIFSDQITVFNEFLAL